MGSMGQFRSKQRIASMLTAGSVLCATLASTEGTAHAAVSPLQVIDYIKKAYDTYKQVRAMFEDSGPTLSEQIAQVQAAIIGELRTQRVQALKSNATATFNLFRNLADNRLNDPTNDELWTDVLALQYQTAAAMSDIINFETDLESAYQLAPAYNALIATGTAVLKMKGELWPDNPSSWMDTHSWLADGIRTDYKLIGARWHQCYPGSNPGYRPEPSRILSPLLFFTWLAKMQPGKYKDRPMWTDKLANRWIHVETFEVTEFEGDPSTTFKRHCNPGKKKCDSLSSWWSHTSRSWRRCSDKEALACAEEYADDNYFSVDPHVKIVREAMRGIQKLSGGNDFDPPEVNDPLTQEGKFVDPAVWEPSCSPVRWAYPHAP